jgi:hypothetical protein
MADEELMSPETVGKYLAKSKAPKTQVTPVRKQDADFRVTPSLTGPATIKRKLGDNEGYPRGFNPQQMGEVREAENTGRMAIFSNSAMTNGRKHAEHEKALVRENVARSRVNPMEIPTETPEAGETPLKIHVQPHGPAGQHYSETRKVIVQPGHTSNPTLIHEMGHAAMDTDEEALRTSTSVSADSRRKLEDAVDAIGGEIEINGDTVSARNLGNHRTQIKKLVTKFNDVRSGYHEGYANKYAADNYVQDPRVTRKQGEWDMSTSDDPYIIRGLVGKYAKNGTRISHFATGYGAAQGPTASLEHSWLKKQVAHMESVPDANRWKYRVDSNSSGEYTYTGGDVLKAAAALRGSTDAEIRGTAPRKRAAKKPVSDPLAHRRDPNKIWPF